MEGLVFYIIGWSGFSELFFLAKYGQTIDGKTMSDVATKMEIPGTLT